jgi:hypothetical protein
VTSEEKRSDTTDIMEESLSIVDRKFSCNVVLKEQERNSLCNHASGWRTNKEKWKKKPPALHDCDDARVQLEK